MVYIIIVNYNGCVDTIECVKSLEHITYESHKIIVVDNGSTDESVSKMREALEDRVILLENKENWGFSGGNNVGIRYALEHGAEFVLLLNNDTLVEPDFLEKLLVVCEKYGGNAVVTPKIMYACDQKVIWYAGGRFDWVTSRTEHSGIGENDTGRYDQTKEVSFISGCCMLIPNGILNTVGLLEEDYFLYCEDLDYCCRAIKQGCKLVYCPDAVIYHKVSASTGRASEMVTYYTVRNKMLVIERHIEKKYQWISRIYNKLEIMKRVLSREYTWTAVKKGYHDYKKGNLGRKTVHIK